MEAVWLSLALLLSAKIWYLGGEGGCGAVVVARSKGLGRIQEGEGAKRGAPTGCGGGDP